MRNNLNQILNFKILFLAILFNISLSADCDLYDVKNVCMIDFPSPDEKLNQKQFSVWKNENSSYLGNYYHAHSESKSSLSGLESQAKRRLASRINVYIESEFKRSSSENLEDFNQSMSTSHYEFYNANLKDYNTITVKDNDMYTVYVYKCKEEYKNEDCIKKNRLSNYINIALGNVKEIVKSNDNNKRMTDLFYELIEAFLYVHSISDSDPQIRRLRDTVEAYLKDAILLPLKNSINIEESEIMLTPYIYIDKDILINIDLDKILDFNSSKTTYKDEYIDWDDFIDGFRLVAIHKNGNSSWENNYSSLEPIDNGNTLLYPGMLLSNTSKQKIDIYADYLFFIDKIKKNKSFDDIKITNRAQKNLEDFINQYSFASVEIKSKNSLPTELTFDSNLSSDMISIIKNTLIKTETSPTSDDKEYLSSLYDFSKCNKGDYDCFEMNFESTQNQNYLLVTLYSPKKSKKKTVKLYVNDNSIKNVKNSLSELHQQFSKSNLKYNFCDDISLIINGNTANPNSTDYEVSGNTDIEIYYDYNGNNRLILDTSLLIYQDIDLTDLEALDIFSLKERELCYSNKDLDYEISFTRKAGNKGVDNLKGLLINWNQDKFIYNDYLKKFIKNNDESNLQNPIVVKQNALDINKIKIRKNGYKTYIDNNVQAHLNFRGQYPLEVTLESNEKFNSFFHYISNLLIPGKGQVQFYKTSNFGKLRGILVGLASYYFTYEMLNSLDDYNYYDNQYKDYFELYGSETDADLIEYYRIEADKNAKLSNSSRSEVSKFALISGVLFSLNAIEITMIHIEF